jgi:hypothetical protein
MTQKKLFSTTLTAIAVWSELLLKDILFFPNLDIWMDLLSNKAPDGGERVAS